MLLTEMFFVGVGFGNNWLINGNIQSLESEMANDEPVWKAIADKHQLQQTDLNKLATAWHTDLDLGRPLEVMTDMSNSRKRGFTVYQDTRESFFRLFHKLRLAKLIP
jgi:hypothetical protein